MYYLNYIYISIILLISFVKTEILHDQTTSDDFKEALFITKLKNQRTFAQFDFTIKAGNISSRTYDLFPRTIAEIVEKHALDYLSFSLAFSNWLSNDWGYQPQPENPVGASLKVSFQSESYHDDAWTNLINSLSGIFCGSWHNSATYYTITIDNLYKEAVFPEESVCTENFSPFLRLLPCKGVAGIASLMNTELFYAAAFNSINLNFNRTTGNLKIMVNFVGSKDKGIRNFDFESLFGKSLSSYPCELASSSKIYIEMFDGMKLSVTSDNVLEKFGRMFAVYNLLEASFSSISGLYENPSIKPRERLSYPPLVTIHSSTSHVGEQSGSIITKIRNNHSDKINVVLSQSIQWYIKVFLHTLTFQCDGNDVPFKFQRVIQSKIRDRPYYFELSTTLPSGSLCILKFNYGLHFLKTSEYPPDAEKGRVIEGIKIDLLLPSDVYFSNATYINMEEIENNSEYIKFSIYGHPISIQLPLPDFSMPFNVICMVCTVMFNFYGSFHALSTKVIFKPTGSSSEQPVLRRMIIRLFNRIRNLFGRKTITIETEKLKTE